VIRVAGLDDLVDVHRDGVDWAYGRRSAVGWIFLTLLGSIRLQKVLSLILNRHTKFAPLGAGVFLQLLSHLNTMVERMKCELVYSIARFAGFVCWLL
jgi:hypothetical protein